MDKKVILDRNIEEDLMLEIEKYPMAESSHLMEYFLIIGYEESYIKEKIEKNIDPKYLVDIENSESKVKKPNIETKIFNEYKCRNLPTLLSCISSNFSGALANARQIIEYVFPIPPGIFYTTPENTQYEPNPINVVFTNIQNQVVNIGYAFIFYENRNIINQMKLYIPKAFVILSQYPYFKTFNNICKELLNKQFKKHNLQIPIEIQLYNIVNFLPAPISEKMIVSIFPSNELFEITKCKSDMDFILLKEQQIYTLNQLSGYRQSEIDISVLFCVLPAETIIEIYLQLISGHIISFFSKSIEILNLTMYIFQQFFFPLAPNENVSSLSPTRYFCSETKDQNIIGFVCGYDELENYNPWRECRKDEPRCLSEEEENGDLDQQMFACDFIIDLDRKIFKEAENYDNSLISDESVKNSLKIMEYLKRIINNHGSNPNSEFESSVLKLLNSLKEISYKLSYAQTKKILPNFFVDEDKFNRRIQDAFYQFNLELSCLYYKYISSYKGDYKLGKDLQDTKIKSLEESKLSEEEYLFFSCFSSTFYCKVLKNIVGGYLNDEQLIYKTPKRIFENFLTLKKENNFNEKLENNFFEIIDEVYLNKNKEKYVSFLEFYKYYKNNLESYFYNIASNKYIEGKTDRKIKQNIKYFYNYKTVDLDKNIIMEYSNLLDKMTIEKKKKLFPILETHVSIKQTIYGKDISESFEIFFIKSKIIEYIDIIKLCILNIVALSVSKETIIYFSQSIYSLLKNLNYSVRKYIEIILSIALRLFINKSEKNLFVLEKYFKIYEMGIEENNLFPNDELIFLKKKIDYFVSQIKDNYKEIIQNDYEKIKNVEDKNLCSIDLQKREKEINAIIQNPGLLSPLKYKLNFKSKYYKGKIPTYTELYSPLMIFNETKNMLNQYYIDLDSNIINKEEYKKLLVYLIFYVNINKNYLPNNINRFLFYCLSKEK